MSVVDASSTGKFLNALFCLVRLSYITGSARTPGSLAGRMLAMNFKDKCDSVRILATVSVGALAMATVPAMAQDATAAPQQPAASQTKYDGEIGRASCRERGGQYV